jgi:Cd2+/Zn2+-exporting ATPase
LKAAFLLLAIAGVATLWMAVLADTGASVIVVANALRLLRQR